MTEEATLLTRQAAYIDTLRGVCRAERNLGFVASLIGVLLLVAGRFTPGAPTFFLWLGLAIVIVGWGLFAWSMFRRAAWVRAHPFEPAE